ncbi:hypothetical protein V5799_015564 [Amblyomma americanum]|uniref:Uncharacterized protein n=1 Tax=Amblyomma americanum TaxID=6943 RepID=A0AAQ4F7F2_AMBAM
MLERASVRRCALAAHTRYMTRQRADSAAAGEAPEPLVDFASRSQLWMPDIQREVRIVAWERHDIGP